MIIGTIIFITLIGWCIYAVVAKPKYLITITAKDKNSAVEVIKYIKRNFPTHKVIRKKEIVAEDYYYVAMDILVDWGVSDAVEIYCKKHSVVCWTHTDGY